MLTHFTTLTRYGDMHKTAHSFFATGVIGLYEIFFS